MTYLDEAYRRFKLPISVVYEPSDGRYWVWTPSQWARAIGSAEAKKDYLRLVKELSHEDQ